MSLRIYLAAYCLVAKMLSAKWRLSIDRNRSFRLVPADQGMKSLSCGMVQANWHGGFCHAPPRPQRGTSPRATFSHPALGQRSTIRQVSPVESRHRGLLEGTSRIGVRDMLSHQSPMPAGAGRPRYEEPELWHGRANWHGGSCYAPPRPQRGTSPRATFPTPTPHNWAIRETLVTNK